MIPQTKYRVVVDHKAKTGYEFRGDCLSLIRNRNQQVVIGGPAESGKTVTACAKLHLTALRYPGSQHAIIRKTYASMAGSVLQTFGRIIKNSGVHIIGADSPRLYNYPNGSKIWVGGMDHPDKALSSERDTIYVCQAEELDIKQWEILSTRCTGRGAVVKYPQLMGDCNPGGSKHWLREKSRQGSLDLLTAYHIDNPTLYAETSVARLKTRFPKGEIPATVKYRGDKAYILTEQGRKSLSALDKLTGIRRKRLLEGIWATSEGAVYPMFDATIHCIHRSPAEMVKWYLAMDEGFTNPQTCLLIGEDNDGRWHVFQEYYVTEHLESEIVAQAKGWYQDVRTAEAVGDFKDRPIACQIAACDAAAAGLIASLKAAGLDARAGKGLIGGNGKVKGGIDKIQDRLAVQKDGRPRLTLEPGGYLRNGVLVPYCDQTVNEFESYVWKPEKDVPIDAFNHAIGGLRYLEDVLNEPTGAWDGKSVNSFQEANAKTDMQEQELVEELEWTDLQIDI